MVIFFLNTSSSGKAKTEKQAGHSSRVLVLAFTICVTLRQELGEHTDANSHCLKWFCQDFKQEDPPSTLEGMIITTVWFPNITLKDTLDTYKNSMHPDY